MNINNDHSYSVSQNDSKRTKAKNHFSSHQVPESDHHFISKNSSDSQTTPHKNDDYD